MEERIEKDINSINRIDVIQTILKILKESTGMRNSAVVSLAEGKWTAACALEENAFGLKNGDQLDMQTTY